MTIPGDYVFTLGQIRDRCLKCFMCKSCSFEKLRDTDLHCFARFDLTVQLSWWVQGENNPHATTCWTFKMTDDKYTVRCHTCLIGYQHVKSKKGCHYRKIPWNNHFILEMYTSIQSDEEVLILCGTKIFWSKPYKHGEPISSFSWSSNLSLFSSKAQQKLSQTLSLPLVSHPDTQCIPFRVR